MDEDEYERKFMSEGGLVYQSKAKAPLAFHLLLLMPSIMSLTVLGILSVAQARPILLLAALPAFLITAPLWLLFSVLRATVTTTHLHIQYGLFGPRIPLENVQSCEAVAYDWKKYGGFGIRRGRDGSWAYNMMGDQGRAVKVKWRDKNGKDVVTLISAPDPDGFVRGVAKARAMANPAPSSAKARVRARLSDKDIADAERELQAELEADNAAAKDEAAIRAADSEKPEA